MGLHPWIKPIKLLCVILIAFPFLTGCWDRFEIEDRSIILGISVDKAKPGAEKKEDEIAHLRGKFPAPDKGMLSVTVQIARPGRIPLGPGEGGGGTGCGVGETVWVLTVVGHTIDDALANLDQQISGRLFLGHLRMIVVSEAVAKNGLQNLNDYIRRNPEVRRMAWMVISKGNADQFMKATPKLERVPTLYLVDTMDDATRIGRLPKNYLGMFWSNSSKKGQEGVLPYVEIKKQQNVEIKGLAFFKGAKMVGKTKPLEIAGYMGIKEINPAGFRGIVDIGDSDLVTIHATNRKSNIDVHIKNGRPRFTVSIINELNVEEKGNEQFLVNNSAILKKIQEADRKAILKTYKGLVKITQNKSSDIFGFGEYVRAKEPKYWNQHIKTKKKWQKMYKDIVVDFNVDIKIRRVGMKVK